jgi:hypothetical protein
LIGLTFASDSSLTEKVFTAVVFAVIAVTLFDLFRKERRIEHLRRRAGKVQ